MKRVSSLRLSLVTGCTAFALCAAYSAFAAKQPSIEIHLDALSHLSAPQPPTAQPQQPAAPQAQQPSPRRTAAKTLAKKTAAASHLPKVKQAQANRATVAAASKPKVPQPELKPLATEEAPPPLPIPPMPAPNESAAVQPPVLPPMPAVAAAPPAAPPAPVIAPPPPPPSPAPKTAPELPKKESGLPGAARGFADLLSSDTASKPAAPESALPAPPSATQTVPVSPHVSQEVSAPDSKSAKPQPPAMVPPLTLEAPKHPSLAAPPPDLSSAAPVGNGLPVAPDTTKPTAPVSLPPATATASNTIPPLVIPPSPAVDNHPFPALPTPSSTATTSGLPQPPVETPPPAGAPMIASNTSAPAPEVPGAAPDLRLSFNENQTEVPLNNTAQLDALAKTLHDNPNARVSIMAYASGPDTAGIYPKRVSLARGIAVRNYLTTSKGIDIERVNVKALGNKNTGGPGDRVDLFILK